MAAPDAAAVAAQGAAADLAIGDVGLTGSTALAEPTLLDLIVCALLKGLRGMGEEALQGRRCRCSGHCQSGIALMPRSRPRSPP